MISFMEFSVVGGGKALVLTDSILGATTSVSKKDWVDIYTLAFPDGITAQMTYESFVELYSNCLLAELDEEE